MLDNPDESGIYPTSTAFKKLEMWVEQERIQAIGWMHAEACTMVDRKEDIRLKEVSDILNRAIHDLNVLPSRQERLEVGLKCKV